MLSPDLEKQIRFFQEMELTEGLIYQKLAALSRNAHNREVLLRIAKEEQRHADFWQKLSPQPVSPNRWKVWSYLFIVRVLGLTFGIKFMEKIEASAEADYAAVSEAIPEAKSLIQEEVAHEKELIALIDEDRLKYVGSVVLGLSDALVELTGALAGLTFALPQGKWVAIAGFITGIAACLSMAASEYLSTQSEGGDKSPWKSAMYTGVAYFCTVVFLIFPYLMITNIYLALALTLINAVIVIFFFTFYVAVAKGLDFRKRFQEMLGICLGVAAVSFVIGFIVRKSIGVEI